MLSKAVEDQTSEVIERKLQLFDPWYRLIVEMLKDAVSEFKGNEILEIGCGFGGFCVFVAKEGGEAIGVDLSHAAIRRAKSLALQGGVANRTDFIVGDARFLPFKDQTNTIVVCSETLEHVGAYEQAFDELIRVTCKMGFLCLTVPNLLSTSFIENVILLLIGQPQYVKNQVCLEKENAFHIFKLKRLLNRDDVKVIMIRSVDFLHLPPRVRRALKLDRILSAISMRLEAYSVSYNLPSKFLGSNIGVLAQKR